jgi:hypothetical protein
MYLLFTDDSTLAGPCQKGIDQIVKDLKRANLNITNEGDIGDFLGVNISFKDDKTIHLTQPYLIDQIVKDLKMNDKMKPKDIPACSSRIL